MRNQRDIVELISVLLPLSLAITLLLAGLILYYVRQYWLVRSMRARYLDDLENERQRISMELHDIYGPYSMQIRTRLENFRGGNEAKVNEIDGIIDKLSHELMLKNQELFPMHIINEPFETALRFLANNLSTDTCAIDVTYESSSDPPREKKIHLYRILQELILNAIKHVSPSFIQIQALPTDNILVFELYYPNKEGKKLKTKRERMGQSIIRERLQRVGASRRFELKDNMTLETISLKL